MRFFTRVKEGPLFLPFSYPHTPLGPGGGGVGGGGKSGKKEGKKKGQTQKSQKKANKNEKIKEGKRGALRRRRGGGR